MVSYQISKEKMEQSKKYLASGVSSSLRASMKPAPLFVESASGARLRDIDGNEYIDYLLAYGPLILGHSHPQLVENVSQAMKKGLTYGLQHDGEIELAKSLTELLPCADRVAFSGSGTEAVMLALRLSRAYTGKNKVVRFYGHYHGWSDSIFTSLPNFTSPESQDSRESIYAGTSGQDANSLKDVLVLPWNDFEALEATLKKHSHEIAAVITEPVMCNSGCIKPLPGYLEQMRKLTEELGIVLIFDEVITGFRLGLGGAQQRFGITPDLVTIGKAMGGGIAISAVAGKYEIMKLIETGKVSHLGTMNGNSVSTVAALTTIGQLLEQEGAPLVHAEKMTNLLVSEINEIFRRNELKTVINQIGPVFHLMFIDLPEVINFNQFQQRDTERYTQFAEHMLHEGVLIRPNGLWYVSTVHQEEDIDQTLEAVHKAARLMK